MRNQRRILLLLGVLAFAVVRLMGHVAPSGAPLPPEQVARQSGLPLRAVVAQPAPATAQVPPPKVSQSPAHTAAKGDGDAELAMALRTIERLRSIPDAAPLVDDIVTFLKHDNADEVSLNNIPTDENGLAVLDDQTAEQLIRNPDIRAKWQRLMALAAAHPEAF